MKGLFFALLLTVALSGGKVFADETSAYDRVIKSGVLRCGSFVWPPYWVKDPNTGALSGLAVDTVEAIAALLDLKVEFVDIVIGQQVEELRRGRIDAVCNDGPYVFTSIKYLDYTRPQFYVPVFAYVPATETRFKNLSDLNHETVTFAGMDSDLSQDLVLRYYPRAKIHTLPSTVDPGQLMSDVITGKANVTIMDPPSVETFNKNNPKHLKALGSPVAIYPVSFSVNKGDEKLLNMLNSATDAFHNTFAAEPLLKKYDPKGEFLWLPAPAYTKRSN